MSAKTVFIANDGGLRCVWRLAFAYLGWFALFICVSLITGSALSAMFAAWGVNNRNLALTPLWVQYLAIYQRHIAFGICGALTAVAGILVCRKHTSPLPHPGMRTLSGFCAGMLSAALLTGIFLLTDSIRPESTKPEFSAHIAIMLAYSLILAIAEGAAAIGYARTMTAKHCGRVWSYIAATLMLVIMNHSTVSSIMGLINIAFVSVAGCCIAEKHGAAAYVGLRAGWLWAETALAGYPGTTGSLFAVYPVSEHLITGGFYGLSEGLALTLCCASVIFFLLVYPCIRKRS